MERLVYIEDNIKEMLRRMKPRKKKIGERGRGCKNHEYYRLENPKERPEKNGWKSTLLQKYTVNYDEWRRIIHLKWIGLSNAETLATLQDYDDLKSLLELVVINITYYIFWVHSFIHSFYGYKLLY